MKVQHPIKTQLRHRVTQTMSTIDSEGFKRGAPEVPPLCRETQSLEQQMLNAPLLVFQRGESKAPPHLHGNNRDFEKFN